MPADLELQQLIDRARAGQTEALGALYDRYSPAIYRYLYRRSGDVTLSEDLTLKEGDPFDEYKAKQDQSKLLDKYHDKGFSDASIAYKTYAGRSFRLFRKKTGTSA